MLDLQVQVNQVGLVQVVDPLQGLSDQAGDLGLRQQLLGHTEVEDLTSCRTAPRGHTGRLEGKERKHRKVRRRGKETQEG